jgi:hypothetical protein
VEGIIMHIEEFKKFYPVMDKVVDGKYPARGYNYRPFIGWLRGDDPVEEFDGEPAVPARNLWGRGMHHNNVLKKLGFKKGKITSVKELYKLLVKFIKTASDSRTLGEQLEMYPVLQATREDKIVAWYMLSENPWIESDRVRFINEFGICPEEITPNIWLISKVKD